LVPFSGVLARVLGSTYITRRAEFRKVLSFEGATLFILR